MSLAAMSLPRLTSANELDLLSWKNKATSTVRESKKKRVGHSVRQAGVKSPKYARALGSINMSALLV